MFSENLPSIIVQLYVAFQFRSLFASTGVHIAKPIFAGLHVSMFKFFYHV